MSESKINNLIKRVLQVPSSLQEFIEEYYNHLVESLETRLNNLGFRGNFDCWIEEDLTILAGETVRITHRLQVVPKHRIITRQTGNSLITDGNFTNKYVELMNNGANDVVLSVILFKE